MNHDELLIPAALSLEAENFRIDSSGWLEKTDFKGVRYLENPSGDVWELLEGDFSGEQYFTREASLRETAFFGKRMPTVGEWIMFAAGTNQIFNSVNPHFAYRQRADIEMRKSYGFKLSGVMRSHSSAFSGIGWYGSLWTSSETWSEKTGCAISFTETHVCLSSPNGYKNGIPVRTLRP